jgi:hypothetical protein
MPPRHQCFLLLLFTTHIALSRGPFVVCFCSFSVLMELCISNAFLIAACAMATTTSLSGPLTPSFPDAQRNRFG